MRLSEADLAKTRHGYEPERFQLPRLQQAVRKLFRARSSALACKCHDDGPLCAACEVWEQSGLPIHARPR